MLDGMAGLLNDMFGAPVTVTPPGGSGRAVQGVFRETPVEIADDNGRAVLVVAPTLRVQRAEAALISRDDIVEPGAGRRYRVLNAHPSGSPAVDAFVLIELEEIP